MLAVPLNVRVWVVRSGCAGRDGGSRPFLNNLIARVDYDHVVLATEVSAEQ